MLFPVFPAEFHAELPGFTHDKLPPIAGAHLCSASAVSRSCASPAPEAVASGNAAVVAWLLGCTAGAMPALSTGSRGAVVLGTVMTAVARLGATGAVGGDNNDVGMAVVLLVMGAVNPAVVPSAPLLGAGGAAPSDSRIPCGAGGAGTGCTAGGLAPVTLFRTSAASMAKQAAKAGLMLGSSPKMLPLLLLSLTAG